ncbi:MAG: signal peptidase I [Archaeoglobaceae archaeon]
MRNAAAWISVVFMLTAVAGYFLDRPILISYVTSDSMTPTLQRGDVFFINPLAGGSVGDIVVFRSSDGWVVHRVVAETGEGFVTKGDANVATDQLDGGVVRKEDVAGVVLSVRGKPLKIPKLGEYIAAISQHANVYASLLLVATGAAMLATGEKKKRKKRVIKVKFSTLYALAAAALIVSVIVATMANWGTLSFSYAVTAAGGQREGWYLPNSEFDTKIEVENQLPFPSYFVLTSESDRISLSQDSLLIPAGASKSVDVHVRAPEETMIYVEKVAVRAYPLVLPPEVIEELADASPYTPLLIIVGAIAAALAAVYMIVGDETIVKIRLRRIT